MGGCKIALRKEVNVKRFNSQIKDFVENKEVDSFINEILTVCKKHGMSISHEDTHGGFSIVKYKDSYAEWFLNAHDNMSEEDIPYIDKYEEWKKEVLN
jgi:hypothetical protein